MTAINDLNSAVAAIRVDAQKFHNMIHGGENTVVSTDGGNVDSVAKALADLVASFSFLNDYDYRQEWNAATAYKKFNIVYRAGSSFVALVDNTNSVPVADGNSTWGLLAKVGTDGEDGPAGPGLTPLSAPWSSSTAYVALNVVYHTASGRAYMALRDGINKNPSTSTTYWAPLTESVIHGEDGTDGEDGIDGTNGISLTAKGTWATGTAYVIGDYVRNEANDASYSAIVAHTSSASNKPPSANWQLLVSDGLDAPQDALILSDFSLGELLCTVSGVDNTLNSDNHVADLTLKCDGEALTQGSASLSGIISFTSNSTWNGGFAIIDSQGSITYATGVATQISTPGAAEQRWFLDGYDWDFSDTKTRVLAIDHRFGSNSVFTPSLTTLTALTFNFDGQLIRSGTNGKAVESIMAIIEEDKLLSGGGVGGIDSNAVNKLIDAKLTGDLFADVQDTIDANRPNVSHDLDPEATGILTMATTNLAGIATGKIVKFTGDFYPNITYGGFTPWAELEVWQDGAPVATYLRANNNSLEPQQPRNITFVGRAGPAIQFRWKANVGQGFGASANPFYTAFTVSDLGPLHDPLQRILDDAINVAKSEIRVATSANADSITQLLQMTTTLSGSLDALKQASEALSAKLDNKALDVVLASDISAGTSTATVDRTPLGDTWKAEIVDHSTIESPFNTAPQMMRDRAVNDSNLKDRWFSSYPGSWQFDPIGSTGSIGAGPGDNSPGPYFYHESSTVNNPTPIDLNGGTNSNSDVKLWLAHNGPRNIEMLYNYVSSSGTGDAFFVAEQLDKDGAVIATRKYSDWEYSSPVAVGQTINLEVGTNFQSEVAGGWRRVGMDLLPTCRSIRFSAIPEVGSTFVNDLAFYDIKISASGLDTPSDDGSSGTSSGGATGQADGDVHGLIIELESGNLNYDTSAIARIIDGVLYGVRQVAAVPSHNVETYFNHNGIRIDGNNRFSANLGISGQPLASTQSFSPVSPIASGTTIELDLSIVINGNTKTLAPITYFWGATAQTTVVDHEGNEAVNLTLRTNGSALTVDITENGSNAAVNDGRILFYAHYDVNVPLVPATTENVRLQSHSGKSIIAIADNATDANIILYYGNNAQFETGLPNNDEFLEHRVLTTSGNPGAFRFDVDPAAVALNMSLFQANYAAGIRYLGLFVDDIHHSRLWTVPVGIAFTSTKDEVRNLETELDGILSRLSAGGL